MKNEQLEIMHLLNDAYNSGSFEDVIPYLADDVKRTSMWEMTDIEGKENMLIYFKEKENKFKENSHHISNLAVLKYIDGQPAGFSRRNVVSAKGSMAGENEIPQGTQIVQWYAEGQIVLHLTSDYINGTNVLIFVEFNKDNEIKQIDICNDSLYHYEIIPDYTKLNINDLYKRARNEIALMYFDQGYDVFLDYEGFDHFPSFVICKNTTYENIYLLVDHYPFYGKSNNALDEFLRNFAMQSRNRNTLHCVQVKSVEEPYHLIKPNIESKVKIIKTIELKNRGTE